MNLTALKDALKRSEVIRTMQNTGVIIYGIGLFAKITEKILQTNHIAIISYVVSDDQDTPQIFNQKEVYSLSKLPKSFREKPIIIAADEKHHQTIIENLSRQGCDKAYLVYWQDISAYCDNYCRRTFLQAQLDLSKPTLPIGSMFVVNPYWAKDNLGEGYFNAFLRESKDLILPFLGDSSLLVEGPYELGDVIVERKDIIIDCGANIGLFSAYAAAQGQIVYAFEPSERTREYLMQNAQFSDGKIIIEPLALSNQNGWNNFIVSENHSGGGRLNAVSHSSTALVPTITLDQFVHERNLARVDFIKADIEGAERLMLAGAQETLRRFAPKLAICTYHLPDDKEVLETLIKQANPDYIITHRWKKLYAYVPSEKRQQLLAQSVKEV